MKNLLISSLLLLTSMPLLADNLTNKHFILVTTHQDEIGEVCPEMVAGQSLKFEFESNHEVEFNLHFHEDEKVTYPIKVQKLRSIAQSFKAPIDQTYCLMWKGLNKKPSKVKIKYSIVSR